MANLDLKLDGILDGIRRSENYLLTRKRNIIEVQERTKQQLIKTEKRRKEIECLENQLTVLKPQLTALEVQLNTNNVFRSKLEEQCKVVEAQVEEECTILNAEDEKREELTERLVGEVGRLYSKVRLDNPEILFKKEALTRELQYLAMEESRLQCEMKVLEDNRRELELIQATKRELETNIRDLQETTKNRDQDLNNQLLLAHQERDSLMDPNSEPIQRLSSELTSAREEGEYLEAALQAMSIEHSQLSRTLRTKGGDSPSLPSSTGEQDSHPSQHRYTFRSSTDTVTTVPNLIGTVTQNASGSTSENGDNEGLKGSTGGQNVGGTKPGVTPSTPRTFTRNSPPPTPQFEMEVRPILPLHLLNLFSCGNKVIEDSATSGGEAPAPGGNSSVPQPSTTTINNPTTSAPGVKSATYMQSASSATRPTFSSEHSSSSSSSSSGTTAYSQRSTQGCCQKTATPSDKYSTSNSASTMPPREKESHFSTSHTAEACTLEQSLAGDAHAFSAGWASMSNLGTGQRKSDSSSTYFSGSDPAPGKNTQSKLHFKFKKTTVVHMKDSKGNSNSNSNISYYPHHDYRNTRESANFHGAIYGPGPSARSSWDRDGGYHPYPTHRYNYGHSEQQTSWNTQRPYIDLQGKPDVNPQTQSDNPAPNRGLGKGNQWRRKIRFSSQDELLGTPKSNN